eukprot:CCRYP_002945-RC/>CCRYP_002945-RC protein AED:0.47 eAED:1.00 QI:0/0/0/1/0/0/2/0/94
MAKYSRWAEVTHERMSRTSNIPTIVNWSAHDIFGPEDFGGFEGGHFGIDDDDCGLVLFVWFRGFVVFEEFFRLFLGGEVHDVFSRVALDYFQKC